MTPTPRTTFGKAPEADGLRVDIPRGDVNGIYEQAAFDALALEEGSIDVDLYRAEDDTVYDDPVGSLTLHYKCNGHTVRFWVDEPCECCGSRPETTVNTKAGTQNPFYHSVRAFAQYTVNDTAPRQYAGG